MAKWEKDVEQKGGVIQEIGAYTGWDGTVSPEDYGTMTEKLERARERFMESKPPEERQQWAKA